LSGLWCDESCWDYGDCCPDVCDVCGICSPNCVDADGDGFYTKPRCGTAVDCDDSDSVIYPGAPEICDGKDNQCPGDDGYGQIDETCSWARTYGGSKNDGVYPHTGPNSIQQTADGGYIVAGYTLSFGAGSSDFWILKLDPSGKLIWTKTYGEDGIDIAKCIEQTSDGGYIVAGDLRSSTTVGGNFGIIKLDINGNKVWGKIYDGGDEDSAMAIQQTSDGGYIITGPTRSFGGGDDDIWILKLDQSGEVSWSKIYGGNSEDTSYAIVQTNDGGYIVAGCTSSYGAGLRDVWVIKLDVNGGKIWDKVFGGADNDGAMAIQQTIDSGFIVAGHSYSYGPGDNDWWIIKLDENGDKIWDKTFGGPYNDGAWDVRQTSDGCYVVVGNTRYTTAGPADYWILKLDPNGNQIWAKIYGGRYEDAPYTIHQTTDGGYIVAGSTESYGAGGYDFWILKLDANGDCPGCF